MAPFLSILTPTYKREKMLEVCKASVRAQTDPDLQHFIMRDAVGLGIANHYLHYPGVADFLIGRYIFVLCDDDKLVDPDLIAGLKRIVDRCVQEPDIIMVKWQYGDRVLPDEGWGFEPIAAHIGLSNWIVRGDIWRANAHHHGQRYAGDWDFIKAIWPTVKDRVYWHDKIVVATQVGPGYGRTEDAIYRAEDEDTSAYRPSR